MSDTVLRQLWLDKIHGNTIQILASLPDEIELQKLAEIADKIADNQPASPVYAATQRQPVASVVDADDMRKLSDRHINAVNLAGLARIYLAEDRHSKRETTFPAASEDGVRYRGKNINRLFYVKDANSGYLFLVDTGAQVSVIPPTTNMATKATSYNLQAANGSRIETYGIIRPSSSPYASPLHMVSKSETGAWRPCGDFRRLNAQTVPDKYPIPHLQDFAITLQGASIFTKLDLRKAFHQIPVAKDDIHKTAVTTLFALFEFTRMPFGLRNAAQSFQRLIDEVLRGLHFTFAYIDDVLIASRNIEEHTDHVEQSQLQVNFFFVRGANPTPTALPVRPATVSPSALQLFCLSGLQLSRRPPCNSSACPACNSLAVRPATLLPVRPATVSPSALQLFCRLGSCFY
ncbi:Retrovirus-related Pol polyprotein from transposon opus,Retrovirus-related Pol polyprotein from transposon gypsy [Acanthosepion pharaonis]|uniref:Retrovirus-related Pol polyprotein from transposon opus,Retrovirus-related Pol polyprotein from transposon gypsy n=1 Tax=Acanthosepion pharaonis TaxID=158019 RepID=A0A812BV46_ACAPH|nr:Retrovirus-related Pol polyprotein from transposon opus,Retrovirus-related Pol polyprotein from transposon gypsy [Sepia pharaonis]